MALEAFEVAARPRSMTVAAVELSVTHGVISQHVRSLEGHLEVMLLECARSPRIRRQRVHCELSVASSEHRVAIQHELHER